MKLYPGPWLRYCAGAEAVSGGTGSTSGLGGRAPVAGSEHIGAGGCIAIHHRATTVTTSFGLWPVGDFPIAEPEDQVSYSRDHCSVISMASYTGSAHQTSEHGF